MARGDKGYQRMKDQVSEANELLDKSRAVSRRIREAESERVRLAKEAEERANGERRGRLRAKALRDTKNWDEEYHAPRAIRKKNKATSRKVGRSRKTPRNK